MSFLWVCLLTILWPLNVVPLWFESGVGFSVTDISFFLLSLHPCSVLNIKRNEKNCFLIHRSCPFLEWVGTKQVTQGCSCCSLRYRFYHIGKNLGFQFTFDFT